MGNEKDKEGSGKGQEIALCLWRCKPMSPPSALPLAMHLQRRGRLASVLPDAHRGVGLVERGRFRRGRDVSSGAACLISSWTPSLEMVLPGRATGHVGASQVCWARTTNDDGGLAMIPLHPKKRGESRSEMLFTKVVNNRTHAPKKQPYPH